jgi:hypothetical protein
MVKGEGFEPSSLASQTSGSIHLALPLLAAPLGIEPRNEWFKATRLYLFAYSAKI